MSLLNTAISESNFRLNNIVGDPRYAGFQLYRRLEKFHAASADTAIVALNGVKNYTSPKADNQTYAGNFISSSITPEVDDQDAVTINQWLTKVKKIGGADSLPGPVIGNERETLNPFALQSGVGNGLVYSYLYLHPGKDTLCMGFADTKLEKKAALAGTWDLVNRKTTIDDKNRSMTFWLLFRNTTWTNTTPTYKINEGTNLGGYGATKNWSATGVPIDSAPVILAAVTGDSVIGKNFTELKDGEGHVDVRRKTGAMKITVTYKSNSYGRTGPEVTKTWYNVRPTSIDTTFTAAKAYTGEAGDTGFIHKAARKDIFENGWAEIQGSAGNPYIAWTDYGQGGVAKKYRAFIERSYKKPIQDSSLAGELVDPADGYYWRIIREFYSCKYSATALGAYQFCTDTTSGARVGNYNKEFSNGLWYAERVDTRIVGYWQDSSLRLSNWRGGYARKDT